MGKPPKFPAGVGRKFIYIKLQIDSGYTANETEHFSSHFSILFVKMKGTFVTTSPREVNNECVLSHREGLAKDALRGYVHVLKALHFYL